MMSSAAPLTNAQIQALPVWLNFVGLMPEHKLEIVRAVEAAPGAQPKPTWECLAGGLKKLTDAQYAAQPQAIKRHYSVIREPARTEKAACCGCNGYGVVGNILHTETCPFCEGTGAETAKIEYTPGKWFDATTVDLMEAFYHSRLPAIREAARNHGYAIGVHGSMRRDLDLIAVPWRNEASDADTLAESIQRAACGFGMASRQWERKPAGRIATSMPVCWSHRPGITNDGHIDLSVLPPDRCQPPARSPQAPEQEPEDYTPLQF